MTESLSRETTVSEFAPPAPVARWQVHRRMYQWAIHWADTPHGAPAMAVLAFCEAIFFPVPADVLLLALCMGRPKRSFTYGLITVIFSVLGGCVAFGLGLAIGGERVIAMFDLVAMGPKADQAMRLYGQYEFWAVATAALTPVPYMMFSWLGGICSISFAGFVVTSAIFRSMRFFAEAAIMYYVGAKAKPLIEKYFNLATVIVIVLLAVVFVLLQMLSHLFVDAA
ncbi:MAG: DedA family protein [Phycisphaerae bacterium]|nr:DedA family protein [Phycisphaerae bacterium]